MTQALPPDDTDESWPSAAERAAAIARANALKAQAAAGGLRFEAYLPPALATWLLDQIARGMFVDPSEAVFVKLGEQHELEPHADLREEILQRTCQAAIDDPHPGFTMEEVRDQLHARMAEPRPEPARWEANPMQPPKAEP